LTRDQAARLRVRPGSHVRMQSPSGSPIRLRVGAIVPDEMGTVGGALVSAEQGDRFGIATPNVLLVAAQSWEAVPTVTQTLTRLLRIGVQVPGLAFLTGSMAARSFGSFRYVINSDGTIAQDAAWVRANIVGARVPILGSVRCHRLIIPQLTAALSEIERAGLAGAIDLADFHRSGGCYVARTQLWDPARPLSMHAWGLALDINVAPNGYGATPHQDPRLVATFERWGFRWGGRWSPPDGMHFELGALLRPR
jgi:D-alanyl-D-alanine carboxypeptidase-like protein